MNQTVVAALARLGDELEAVGDRNGAALGFETLLKFDPEDRVGISEELERAEAWRRSGCSL